MADAINIIFHSPSACNIGPMIYLHWNRSSIVDDLTEALPRMRTGDVEYASARFIGCAHEKLEGSKNLGCANLFIPESSPDEDDTAVYCHIMSEIPPDVARVNVDTWELEFNGQVTQLPASQAAPADGIG